MGHGAGMAAPTASTGPDMETPPPPEAGSGPPRAADAIWGAEAMASSRNELRRTHGNFPVFWFQGDRLETQVRGALTLVAGSDAPILLAYEPVWAIGVNGIPATSDYADARQAEIIAGH